MGNPVRDALKLKVSRERIGTEIDGMFKGPNPVMAVQHLVDLLLFPIVFLLPENLHLENYGQACLATMQTAFQILEQKGTQLTSEERRLYLLAALLVPIHMLKGPHASGKGARHFSAASAHVIWEGLRWRNKDSRDVEVLHEGVPDLIALYNRSQLSSQALEGNGASDFKGNLRVDLGLWIRQMKSLWHIGVLLAPIFTMHESVPLEMNPVDYPLFDFIQTFNGNAGNGNQSPESHTPVALKRLRFCDELENMIRRHEVEDAWKLKPLLDGRSLMAEIGLQKGGPILGELLDLSIKWQLANPTGKKDQCCSFLQQAYDSIRQTTSNY